MGSYCELKFDKISILTHKSDVPDAFVCLFQDSDRREIDRSVGYFAPRSIVLERLDLLGYTAESARRHFQQWLEEERETYREYTENEDGEWASETAEALRRLTYDEWQSRAREVLLTRYDFSRPLDEFADVTDRHMRELSGEWLFYDEHIVPIVRSLLQVFTDTQEVSLDIGDLINGGYMDANERLCETRRSPHLRWHSDLQPTVIIPEGSTDIIVLKRSLQRLYPYLTDYFTFFDFDGPKVDGGASYLVKFLRAFAAARINTNIIAIFDNDASGIDAFTVASKLPLPANIKVTRLPDIDMARSYPTIGPQGAHNIDINGKAVSIELFLGRHNISTDDGMLVPVVWSNYVAGVRQYQGAIDGKKRALDRFLEDTNLNEGVEYYRARFPELVGLWEHLVGVLR